MKRLLIATTLLFSASSFAYSDGEVIETQQMDIDGQVQVSRNLSSSERLRLMRKQIEKQTEVMVKKKMEHMRIQKEKIIHQQMMKSMQEMMNRMNNVQL